MGELLRTRPIIHNRVIAAVHPSIVYSLLPVKERFEKVSATLAARFGEQLLLMKRQC
jgi:hypothetical protein